MSSPERLAYWYLRLNGFLTIENFVVHDDMTANQRTDADILAVRFGNRSENLTKPMVDDQRVIDSSHFCNVVIAEIKSTDCALNGPWTNQRDRNVERVLSAVGVVPANLLYDAACAIYKSGRFEMDGVMIRLMAFGDVRSRITPEVEQVTFDEMIGFIWERFREYNLQKKSIGNWAPDGREMRQLCPSPNTSLDDFRTAVRRLFGLRPEPPNRDVLL
ncbi:MAG: hypothetical protein JST35_08345 [Armatimonadetes bacterium]|nr:hypothetical protein [Armatimonadota bacterium]